MTTMTQDQETTPIVAPPVRKPWLRILCVVLTLVGLIITSYLTYTKLNNAASVCPTDGTFNCELVQGSIYSRIFGVPIQYLGLLGYIGILIVLALEWFVPFFTRRGPLLVFGMTLFGFLYSAYLTSIEAFVLKAWCLWCLGSAITMTTLFVVSLLRLWRSVGDVPLLSEEELVDDE
jgi:uncharacterized membrane protein